MGSFRHAQVFTTQAEAHSKALSMNANGWPLAKALESLCVDSDNVIFTAWIVEAADAQYLCNDGYVR